MADGTTNAALFKAVAEMAVELGSLYKDNRFGRSDLLDFMDGNEWFGNDDSCGFECYEAPLTLWLSAYKRPGREKIALMLEHFVGVYPITCHVLRTYIANHCLEDTPSAWKLVDFVLSEIDQEVIFYSEEKLEELAKHADNYLTLGTVRQLAHFLREATHNGKPLTEWVYDFNSRGAPGLNREAYPIDGFSVMAYCVFNEDWWERQGMVEKAVRNKSYADLWLYTALHFICALRAGDMTRLPAPALPCAHADMLKKVSDGVFTRCEAITLAEEFVARLKLKPLKPSKTSMHQNIPDLKLFIPEGLKAPLGVIMAIALAHHPEVKPGGRFVSPSDRKCVRNLYSIRSFYGEHFAEALEENPLSSRRCNKSYLQGIEATVPGTPGKPKGYMLAALARSHKSGIANLAKTTDIYLKDANFSGYSPEFIMREMFERGIFSFIPAILLEMYSGFAYKLLPVKAQTALIKELGLTARQIEQVTDAVNRMQVKSRSAVHDILRDTGNIRGRVSFTLQNIASGNAPSRQDDILCLMTAAGAACPFADRNACMGCGYEIFTKSVMHSLVSEYGRLLAMKKVVGSPDAPRCQMILEQAVLPAISEMLIAAKSLYQEDSITGLLDIVERGIDYIAGDGV